MSRRPVRFNAERDLFNKGGVILVPQLELCPNRTLDRKILRIEYWDELYPENPMIGLTQIPARGKWGGCAANGRRPLIGSLTRRI